MSTTVTIAKRDESEAVPAHLSKSGRWAAHRHTSGAFKGKAWDVSHVPTGLSANVETRTLKEARAFLEAFDALETPLLDALPFGKINTESSALAKPDLLAVWDARKATKENAR